MTSMKIEANSLAGEIFAADIRSGAVKFDETKGAFFKPSTQQEYLLTNKDRLVRVDGAVGTLNEYSKGLKDFCPIDALRDGEQFDRARKLTQNDILAKPTWKQWASEGALVVAQGAVTGAALGAIGGAIYGVASHRRLLSGASVVPDNAANSAASSNAGAIPGIGVARAALRTPYDGPYNPGDLRRPDPININMPVSDGLSPAQAAQENAAQGAFAGAGAVVGGCIGGPIGAAIGAIVGGGIGAAWNEIVR